MLDVPSITFLSNYLQTYPSTVLVVSHDRAFLNEVATDIIHQHSERLDYYKGANFGNVPRVSYPVLGPNVSQNLSTPPKKNVERMRNGNMRIKWPNEHISRVRMPS
jgi:hypothetical protein